MLTSEYGEIVDVKTKFSKDKGFPTLEMGIEYENGSIDIHSILLDTIEIIKKEKNLNEVSNLNVVRKYDLYQHFPTYVTSCELKFQLSQDKKGAYAKIYTKFPIVNKVYNVGGNLMVGVDQSDDNDKTSLCFSRFKDGKFTVERFEYINKQHDMDEYINENKHKWI